MDALYETLQDFIIDYQEYLPPNIPVLKKEPTPHEFYTNHVMTNSPFLLNPLDGLLYPKAREEWQKQHYLRKAMYRCMVTVAVTPDGRADSIVDDKFMIPEERRMWFNTYYDYFLKPREKEIYYLQKQDNNLIEEFSPILGDVSRDIPWATEAFGNPPEAANIWMGDHYSVTSLHKDHYENIYCVIAGVKTFKLYPPLAILWMPYKKCPKFQWYFEEFDWKKKDLNEQVKWIPYANKPETPRKLALYDITRVYTIDVLPGQALYIPSLWFHEVRQTDECIAVNYWYDMQYEVKYPLFCLLEAFSKLPVTRKDASVDTQTELEDQLVMDLVPEMPIKKGFPKRDPAKKQF